MKIYLIALKLLLLSIFTTSFAHEYSIGDLIIDHPIARETPPGVKVGAGYFSITNNGQKEDKLISAKGDFAAIIEIHSTSMENNIMKMNEIENGLIIPAGETVTFKPGGLHLMFKSLLHPLIKGEKHKVILLFEKSGEVEITFNVEKIKVDEHSNHHKHSH